MSALSFIFIAALSACPSPLLATQQHEAALVGANPIRKVVTMLQSMYKRVEEEGVKEKELFDKYMCYCKSSGGDLKASIANAGVKLPATAADIKAGEAQLVQLKASLKEAQMDRSEVKAAMASATSIRGDEASSFAKEKAMYDANIAAIKAAVSALESGMAGAFLQTKGAESVRQLVNNKSDMLEEDRQEVLSFLAGAEGSDSKYAPSSGEVVGILKQMGDEMAASLKEVKTTETSAVTSFDALMVAKKKQMDALTASIESKTQRIGELSVEVIQMQNDLTDTEEALVQDKDFLADLEKNCATKTSEWEVVVKTRVEELAALSETIKVLNDDDSLELFKKTLPSTAASLVQVAVTAATLGKRALVAVREAGRREEAGGHGHHVRLDLIALALHGRKVDYAKVIKMIDDMVGVLKAEQLDDDHKQEYCAMQFDLTDDKKKGLERTLSDEEGAIATAEDGIAKLAEDISALEAGIKALDKSLAEASEQRHEESEDFTSLMASDSAAKDLLGFAKNRLNKFYNPKLYVPPPKVELSAADRIEAGISGTEPPTEAPGGIAGTGIAVFAQVSAHTQRQRARRDDVAPPPPPETFGPYTKKTEENTGVIAMMDLLMKDLDKEMAEAKVIEKDSQADYEVMVKASVGKRTADAKLLTEKGATKADMEGELEAHKEAKAGASSSLAATLQYISSLHAECDWLIKYYGTRKAARDEEIDNLKNAKAVLSGADYSLIQTGRSGLFLSPRRS
jgi:septal ring factor EnvC (AmiA/AmiB activator)